MDKSFYFAAPDLPTSFNLSKHLRELGYEESKPGTVNEHHFELDEAYTQLLEYKHLLAELCERRCPDVMPFTVTIDDHNYREVIATVSDLMKVRNAPSAWILKPSMLNNGEGIHLFESLEQLSAHYASNRRLGGPHVLQAYLSNPHLLQGHKYTLRLFVVLSSFSGAFIYPHGYFNIARSPYSSNDFEQLSCHLTNEHLSTQQTPNNWQMPTEHTPHFNKIYPSLVQIATKVMSGLRAMAPNLFERKTTSPQFGIFGFDYLLDASLRPWLLEVNHGPCFPCDPTHPLQAHLYDQFWRQLILEIIEPTLGLSSKKEKNSHTLFQELI